MNSGAAFNLLHSREVRVRRRRRAMVGEWLVAAAIGAVLSTVGAWGNVDADVDVGASDAAVGADVSDAAVAADVSDVAVGADVSDAGVGVDASAAGVGVGADVSDVGVDADPSSAVNVNAVAGRRVAARANAGGDRQASALQSSASRTEGSVGTLTTTRTRGGAIDDIARMTMATPSVVLDGINVDAKAIEVVASARDTQAIAAWLAASRDLHHASSAVLDRIERTIGAVRFVAHIDRGSAPDARKASTASEHATPPHRALPRVRRSAGSAP